MQTSEPAHRDDARYPGRREDHRRKARIVRLSPPATRDKMLRPSMNNTKWNELRLAMYELECCPSWSTLATNGFRSKPDREWFYHFRDGGYEYILHVDILVDGPEQRQLVHSALGKVHVPGEETPEGFRVFGYLRDGQAAVFI